MPIVERDGKIHIQLNTGELWSEGGKPKEFKDWQAAQAEYAEGRVPSGIEHLIKEVKHGASGKT